jgi:hypothetical protein
LYQQKGNPKTDRQLPGLGASVVKNGLTRELTKNDAAGIILGSNISRTQGRPFFTNICPGPVRAGRAAMAKPPDKLEVRFN